MNLYDPETLKQLQAMFAPLFQQQQTNLMQQQTRAEGQAGQKAGAWSAAQGFANPQAYSQGYAQRIAEAYAPQYGQLQANQLQALLGATGQSGQFKGGLAQASLGVDMERCRMNEQAKQQPTFLENLIDGLIGGGASVLGGWLGSSQYNTYNTYPGEERT